MLATLPAWRVESEEHLSYLVYGNVMLAGHDGKWKSRAFHGPARLGP